MLTKKTLTLAAMLTALTLAGCFTAPGSADVYSVGQARANRRFAWARSKACVRCASSRTAAAARSARSAAALGAVAGSAIGGGEGSILTAIAGGLVGAVAGNAVGENLSTANGVEITVRLDNGDLRSITQAASGESSAQASAYDCCRAAASRASRTNEHPQHAAQAGRPMCKSHMRFFVHAPRITSMPGRVRAKIPPSGQMAGPIE
jgi:outer membrane lipoprotein SlyB